MNHKAQATKQQILTPDESKRLVETYVSDLLISRREQSLLVSPYYESLWQAIEKLFHAGGKRFRPYMMILSYQAFGGSSVSSIIPAAAAQELVHQATLIHDDIIDRDLIRYKIKNITGQFEELYKDLLHDDKERRHFAESAAILAGDLLLSEAHVQMTHATVDSDKMVAAQRILAESVFHVAGGELLDTEAAFRHDKSIDPLTIAAQKTASYSFIGPLTVGATLAGASTEQIAILTHIGNTIGIAYQLRDDIIGVFGNEAITGKSSEGDICEGKRTLLIDEFYKRASDDQKKIFETTFGNTNATTNEITTVKDLLVDTGAKAAIESYIANYQTQTIEQLSQLDMDEVSRHTFAALIQKSLEREN